MTLVCRPPGKGNWKPVIVIIEQSKHAPLPMCLAPGMRIEIGGQVLRVAEVWA